MSDGDLGLALDLNSLMEEGLVKVAGTTDDGLYRYALTEKGQEYVEELLREQDE